MKTLKTLLVMMVLGSFSLVGFAQTTTGTATLDSNQKIVLDQTPNIYEVYEVDIASANFSDEFAVNDHFKTYFSEGFLTQASFTVDFADQVVNLDISNLLNVDLFNDWVIDDFNNLLQN